MTCTSVYNVQITTFVKHNPVGLVAHVWAKMDHIGVNVCLNSPEPIARQVSKSMTDIRVYNKNPCLCGNCTFPNEVHHQRLGNMRPRPRFPILMMHQVLAWVLGYIPWPACIINLLMDCSIWRYRVRNLNAAIWKSHISTHPLSAWDMSWAWDIFVLL